MSHSSRPSSPAVTSGVRLRSLFPDAEFVGVWNRPIHACSADSRACQPGDLFIARVGTVSDGHDHADEAISRGASAILTERLLPVDVPQCIVPDTRVAHGQLCQALAGDPSRSIKVIGITGTNGKTTTTCLIASILQAGGFQPGLLGTLGYCDGDTTDRAPLTTPSTPVLADWLRRMVVNGCTHAVMEVSSHALAQHRIAGVAFDAIGVTNVRRDHLDFHGSLTAYRGAKRRLFEQLSPEGFAVVNADDPVAANYLTGFNGPALTIGMTNHAEVSATLVERCVSEQTFLLNAGCDTIPVRTRMIGDHHISNCLVATAIGLTYGIDLHDIVRGLEAIEHVPGRLERIECGQSFGAFVDFAHTPDALACTLKTLREVTAGKLICVFGAGGDRDRQKRPLMGTIAEELADMAIVTTDNPRTEDHEAIAREILSGCKHCDEIEVVCDRSSAIRRALSLAEPNDCVVVAGKGHEDYQIIGNERYKFDDRQVVRDWLYKHSEQARRHSYAA
jgi:UDP-N-acetylmuramoyl-L-alanyl-D-glutamate--2,6-diaminopimelate ligase